VDNLYLVIAAKSYDFKNDAGERVQGLNVTYLDPEMREDTETQVGLLPLKVPALSKVFSQIEKLPGYYELDFRQRPDGKGKPVLTLASCRFKAELDIGLLVSEPPKGK
jgi:hypothetical protein